MSGSWLPRNGREWFRWMEKRVREQERSGSESFISIPADDPTVVDASRSFGVLDGNPEARIAEEIVDLPIEGDAAFAAPADGATGPDYVDVDYSPEAPLYPVDTTPPAQPSAPIPAVRLGVVTLVWDGNAEGGGVMDDDLDHIEVNRSQEALDFFPNGDTYVGRLYAPGMIVMPEQEYNSEWFYRFVGVDTSGNRSEPSFGASAVTTPLVDTDIIGKVLSGANFMDGTIDTAALADGSISAEKIAQDAIDITKINFTIEDIGGMSVSFTPDAPLDPPLNKVWYDTNDDLKGYRWDGTQWQPLSAAASPGSGGTTNYYLPSAPPGVDHVVGSTWFNTSDGYKPSRWDGDSWEPYVLGVQALAPDFDAQTLADAAADALAKANAAQAAAVSAAALTAQEKADLAKAQALAGAATDATTKADNAKALAIAAAATDAQTKASAAQTAAISAAATDATTKASNAQAAAIAAAATTAQQKADLAQAAAIAAAATDAQTKASAAQTAAIAAAATDAQTKASAAQAAAIAAAATTAQEKADLAQAAALAASLPKVSDSGGVRVWRDRLNYYNPTPSSTDRIVIRTNMLFTGPMVRFKFEGAGLAQGEIAAYASLYLYSVGGGTIHVPGFTSEGSLPVTMRFAKDSGNRLVLILTSATSGANFSYPRISIPEVQTAYQIPTDAQMSGWTAEMMTEAALTAEFGATIVPAAATLRRDLNETYGLTQAWRTTGTTTIDGGKITADSVTAGQISANAITASELAALAVVAGKIDANAVTATTIAAGAVVAGKLAADSVLAANIKAGEVTAGKLAAGAVVAGTIAADAVTSGTIAAGAVTAGKIAALSITAAEIATDAITATKVLAGAIVAGKLAADSVLAANIKAGEVTAGKLAAGAVVAGTIAADAVTSGTIAAGAVTAGKIAALSIVAGDIATDAITSTKILAGAITTAKINAGAVTANEIATDAITAVKVSAGAIVAGKLATDSVLAANIKAGEITAGKLAAGAVVAGNVAAGAVTAGTIAANAVTAGTIAALAVDASKIAADTITAAQIAANAITSSEIAANAVIAGKINAGAVTAGTIAADAVTATTIAANAVVAGKIATGAVTAGTIAALAVTAGTVAANAIGANEIAANAVVAGKIAANAVTTGTIAALAVDAGKIAANAITADKIAAGAITAVKIDADALNGKTITGAIIQTAASGARLGLNTDINANVLTAYTGRVDETVPASLRAETAAGGISLRSATLGADAKPSSISIESSSAVGQPSRYRIIADADQIGLLGRTTTYMSAEDSNADTAVVSVLGVDTSPAPAGMTVPSGLTGAISVNISARPGKGISANGKYFYARAGNNEFIMSDAQYTVRAYDTPIVLDSNKGVSAPSMAPVFVQGAGAYVNPGAAALSQDWPGAGAHNVVFTVPPSGKVKVTFGAFVAAGVAGRSTTVQFRLANASTAAVIRAADPNEGFANYNTGYVAGTKTVLVTGLTVGMQVRAIAHIQSAINNTSAAWSNGSILVEPVL